jgi:hypothetical protein
MLTYKGLVDLQNELHDDHVLSVYLDGAAEDFAAKRVWKLELDHSLKNLRSTAASSTHSEREELEECINLLESELATLPNGLRSRGWAAFITRAGLRHSAFLHVPVPNCAFWGKGPIVALYVHALKQTRPVIVILADARKATIFSYAIGELEKMTAFHAHTTLEPVTHMGDTPRQGFHRGVSGTTGRDAAQRAMITGTNRMIKEVTDEAVRLAGPEGWILTGGIPRVSQQLAESISELAPSRVLSVDSLDVHSSRAVITAAAEQGASALRDKMDLQRIVEIADRSSGIGVGALGFEATLHALEQSAVRDLYLTRSFIENHQAEAEVATRLALSGGALVEEVSGAGAAMLDENDGIAARFRYRLLDADAHSMKSANYAAAPTS